MFLLAFTLFYETGVGSGQSDGILTGKRGMMNDVKVVDRKMFLALNKFLVFCITFLTHKENFSLS